MKNTMVIDYLGSKNIDFIGDIHGHFDTLIKLFDKLGYKKSNGMYSHPERIPVFIGDYIDRGPKIFEVLQLVRSMQENGLAIALMGNHEYNFLCFQYTDKEGKHFRENSTKYFEQLKDTKLALSNGNDLDSYLNWMSTLPIAIDAEKFRAVHAQWSQSDINLLKNTGIKCLDKDGLSILFSNENKDIKEAVNRLLKGYEEVLDEKLWYKEHDNDRKEGRVKWWKKSKGKNFEDVFASLPKEQKTKDISSFTFKFNDFYPADEKPVFFGHYWMEAKDFGLMNVNACCVDFSVAKKGLLVAYRFSGEQKLEENNLIQIACYS